VFLGTTKDIGQGNPITETLPFPFREGMSQEWGQNGDDIAKTGQAKNQQFADQVTSWCWRWDLNPQPAD